MSGSILENYSTGITSHVSDIYSPPRVTMIVERFKLIPGLAFDLTAIDPDDGEPWDFNN